MAFKGKSTIELRNAETGELEFKAGDENMVTNAAANLMNGTQLFPNIPNFSSSGRREIFPLLDKLFSGLLMFEKNIVEDPNVMGMPYGNRCVGHAHDVYTGLDPYTGTINNSETTVLENGKRYVWDFPTDKGNGTIRSVALTSSIGGCVGIGSELSDGEQGNFISDFPFVNYLSPQGGTLFSLSDYDYAVIGIKDVNTFIIGKTPENTKGAVVKGISTIILRKRIYQNKVKLKDNYSYSESEKTITSSKRLTAPYFFQQIGKEIYSIFPYDTNKFDVVIFDMDTLTIKKEETVTVQDAVFKQQKFHLQLYPDQCALYKGYYYIRKNDTDFYKINKDDPTDYSIAFSVDTYKKGINLIGDLMYLNEICYNGSSSSIVGFGYVYNGSELRKTKTHCNSYYSDRTMMNKVINNDVVPFPYVITQNASGLNDSYNNRYYLCLKQYTPFLSTINNLSTPVVKNETQTMKVTYEITEI